MKSEDPKNAKINPKIVPSNFFFFIEEERGFTENLTEYTGEAISQRKYGDGCVSNTSWKDQESKDYPDGEEYWSRYKMVAF